MKRILFYIFLITSLVFITGCSGQKEQNQKRSEKLVPGRIYSKEYLYSWFEDELEALRKAEETNEPIYSRAIFFHSEYVNLDDVMNGEIGLDGLGYYLRRGGRHYCVGNIMNYVCINVCGPSYYFQQIGLDKYRFLVFDMSFWD